MQGVGLKVSIGTNIGFYTWGSRELLPFKKFIRVLKYKSVGIEEYCLRELGQLPAVDLQQGTIRLEFRQTR